MAFRDRVTNLHSLETLCLIFNERFVAYPCLFHRPPTLLNKKMATYQFFDYQTRATTLDH